MSELVIRDLSGMDEFFMAEELQRVVWGRDDTPDPADLMMVLQHEGGLVGGAFEAGELIGYVFGFATRDPSIQHSHRLAVHPKARGRGLAIDLKRYQRLWCLERGIRHVRWTFDPLRHINASLNVGRLGVVISKYHPDYYGVMKGINAGLASDRLLADWFLDHPRVEALSKRSELAHVDARETFVRVNIPANLDHLVSEDLTQAQAERMRVREALMGHFANGYAIVGYDHAQCAYLLSRDG